MTLILAPGVWEAISAHVCATYPEEGCGLLLGTVDAAQERRTAFACFPAPNRWLPVSARRRHYLIEAEDVVRAERQARRSGWDLIGVFHSHPDHAATPSMEDRESAWPGLSYLIASVALLPANDYVIDTEIAKISSLFSWVFNPELRIFCIEPICCSLSA